MSKYDPLRAALRDSVLGSPGVLSPEARQAIARGEGVDPKLESFVAKVHAHAYRITDDEVRALGEAGLSDDAIFEATVSAAYGASMARLDWALKAMEDDDATRQG
jgi:hypothetical protein